MPLANFKRIVEVSSEDPVHNASNLLKMVAAKKWKTKTETEKSAYVILELDGAHMITGIDIGNEHSAFVEVLVGRVFDAMSFHEILITSSFMTPIESRNSTNTNRVRIFGKNDLVDSIASQKWSMIKVLCTQPFNKRVQYGLSFIKVHVEESKENKNIPGKCQSNSINDKSAPQISKFLIREISPDSDSETSKGLFARWKESRRQCLESKSDGTLELEKIPRIQDRNRRDIVFGEEEEKSNKRLEMHILADNKRLLVEEERNKKQLKKQTTTAAENISVTKKTTQESASKSKKQRKLSPKTEPAKKVEPKKTVKLVPFQELLRGVILVISGIQNPVRGDIRSKALAMGAKYKTDWDSSCTHLICAFKNTPKYNQVKGTGKIVKQSWIEQCFQLKKRLPWRRYAIDHTESSQPESDEEIFADTLRAKLVANYENDQTLAMYDLNYENTSSMVLSSSSDSDEDMDKIKPNKTIVRFENDEVYEKSTEEEEYLESRC